MKLGMISLGCAKNRIDSELFLGMCTKYNLTITNQLQEADIIVINTCGFIEPAKKEALDTIFEMLEYQKSGKIIVVMGCLVERYLENLKQEIPEVDYFWPIKDYDKLGELFASLTNTPVKQLCFDYTNRTLTTLPHSAYLRIGEGCNNNCTYCAIPLIRGRYVSRTMASIMEEAKTLATKGVKELTLIAQDTTRYGTDLQDASLANLLQMLAESKLFPIIRVLYLYPDEITDELINTIAQYDCIVKYFDIPLQHASDTLLKAMNRRGELTDINALIGKIRKVIPSAVIRSTMILGFPGETKEDFDILKKFVSDTQFDYLGCFCYSDEEGTKAFDFYPKVAKNIAQKRYNQLLEIQQKIVFAKQEKMIGKVYPAIIDQVDHFHQHYLARLLVQAPDDVDGGLFIKMHVPYYETGSIINVKITGYDSYDLQGIIIEKEINDERN